MPISKLLKLPYGSYLMVRLDYIIICGDELEAKIMRIIEMYMEDERRILYKELLNDPKNTIEPEATVEVTKDVWAAISHRLFKNDLYDQDMSENTLKRALKSLVKKKYIRVRDDRSKRYEAPKYQINTDVVQGELDTLSRIGKTEYQKLMVSKIDGIKSSRHQNETPSAHQNLTVSPNLMVSKIDPNSRRVTDTEEDTEEESTYSAQPETATTSANADTHAQSSQDAPYQPNFNASQSRENNSHIANQTKGENDEPDNSNPGACGHRLSHSACTGSHGAGSRASHHEAGKPTGSEHEVPGGQSGMERKRVVSEQASSAVAATQDAGYMNPPQAASQAQLSTLSASSPQASAKVEQKQGTTSSKAVTPKEKHAPPTAQLKPQLTLLGGQAREWYEIIRATRLRLTANNIKALNVLGDLDGMSFENLKETIETIDDQDFVKSKNIPIGPQELASEDGYWRFDKWLPVVVRNRQRQASNNAPPKSVSSLPSYHTMSDEEYYASLRGGNAHARAAYAR